MCTLWSDKTYRERPVLDHSWSQRRHREGSVTRTYGERVKRVLLTGMSGVGKSTVVARLVALGHRAVDLDDGWCEVQPDGRQLWREAAVEALLAQEEGDLLFVAGCEPNMPAFLPRFDVVILLSAPQDVLVARLDTRTSNPFGKSLAERSRVLEDLRTVEPRLRAVAHHEVRTTAPVEDVVQTILCLADRLQGQ